MKRKVYDYLFNHSRLSVHEIALAISANELDVLKAINELHRGGYVKMDTPVPLSCISSDSCFYSATGKKYEYS